MNRGSQSFNYLCESLQNINSLEGYIMPRTCHYISHDYTFPKADRKLNFEHATSNSPGPAVHSESHEASLHRYWEKSSGSFPKGPKEFFMAKTLKKTQSLPGPAHYFPQISKDSKKIISKLGRFGKDVRPKPFDNIEALSQTVPSSYIYKPYEPIKRMKNGIYHSMYFKPSPESLKKKSVGPGSYNPDISLNKHVMKRTIVYKCSKADRLIKKISKERKKKLLSKSQIPAVGTYNLINDSFSLANSMKHKKTIISPYQLPRVTELEAKQKVGIPGPGAYNIGPLPKIYKKEEGQLLSEKPLKKKKFIKEV